MLYSTFYILINRLNITLLCCIFVRLGELRVLFDVLKMHIIFKDSTFPTKHA